MLFTLAIRKKILLDFCVERLHIYLFLSVLYFFVTATDSIFYHITVYIVWNLSWFVHKRYLFVINTLSYTTMPVNIFIEMLRIIFPLGLLFLPNLDPLIYCFSLAPFGRSALNNFSDGVIACLGFWSKVTLNFEHQAAVIFKNVHLPWLSSF